jgi:hypothetical protein
LVLANVTTVREVPTIWKHFLAEERELTVWHVVISAHCGRQLTWKCRKRSGSPVARSRFAWRCARALRSRSKSFWLR